MSRVIPGVLVFLCVIPVCSAASDVSLEPLVISPYRTEISSAHAAQHIDVISSEELASLPAHNAGEALYYIAGVNVQENRKFGRPSAVSLMGSDSRQVRVMVDGIPFNTQSSGQVNLSLFPIANIDRIEVITGPASSSWGSSLGGVINIITKSPEDGKQCAGSFRKSWAAFKTSSESLQASGSRGPFGFYALTEYGQSGGRGPHDDTLEKKGFVKTVFRVNDAQKVQAEFGYSGADVNSGIFPDGSWMFQPYRAQYGKLEWKFQGDNLSAQIEGKHSRQYIISRFFGSAADNDFFLETKTRDLLYQLSFGSAFRGDDGLLVGAGMDIDYDVVKSDLYLPKAQQVKTLAPFVNAIVPVGQWDLNAGIRHDQNSEYGEQLSPSLGAVYHIQSVTDGKFRISVARAFTAPPLLWKFNTLPAFGVAPNPFLKPEHAWTYEAGIEGRPMKRLFAGLTGYCADVTDGIARGTDDAGNTMMVNFQSLRRQGVHGDMRITVFEWLDAFAGAAFNDIVDRKAKQGVQGGGRPRQTFDYGLEYHNAIGTKIAVRAYYNYWNEPPSSQPNDKKTLCDVRVSQAVKQVTLFLDVYNIGNAKYWEDYFFPNQGRYFEGGFNLQW